VNHYRVAAKAPPGICLRARVETKVSFIVLFLLALVSFSLVACRGSNRPPEKRYALKGRVVSIEKQEQRVVVDHEAIPGFMSAMTMPYRVKDPKDLDRMTPGDTIQADVVVIEDSVWLENIVIVKGNSQPTAPPSGQLHQPQPGEKVPDFALVNQDGKRIHLREYAGKVLVVTFIYTRCPLPDYCPRMNKNFGEIEKGLAEDKAQYSKTRLLSISFDPTNDTPPVLRKYAAEFQPVGMRTDFQHWSFAVAPAKELKDIASAFGLYYKADDGQIVHSMSTSVISPDGKIYKWYHGNAWEPADVLNDVKSLLADESSVKASGKTETPETQAAREQTPTK
jgi:protein SCO1/2